MFWISCVLLKVLVEVNFEKLLTSVAAQETELQMLFLFSLAQWPKALKDTWSLLVLMGQFVFGSGI